jgi:hypothetical protein
VLFIGDRDFGLVGGPDFKKADVERKLRNGRPERAPGATQQVEGIYDPSWPAGRLRLFPHHIARVYGPRTAPETE